MSFCDWIWYLNIGPSENLINKKIRGTNNDMTPDHIVDLGVKLGVSLDFLYFYTLIFGDGFIFIH